LETELQIKKALLTTSCTHSLEMAAILADIQPGDEVIMPSFTFVSTANAFALRGAKIIFVDIRPDTLNLDESLIESAITSKTKAIVPVHYAGVACVMDTIMEISNRHGLCVIEDAAQGVMSTYKGRALGSIGHIGCYSFDAFKNITCGEGGAILLNDERYIQLAEIVREKGTNRSRFFRGEVDKYTWVDVGSNYLPSQMNAAYLYAQLEDAEIIQEDRLAIWNHYFEQLKLLAEQGKITLPEVPADCMHNSHIFYFKTNDLEERTELLRYLKENGITASSHFVPLHSTDAGLKFGSFHREDRYTTKESERLIRLPIYYGLMQQDRSRIVDMIHTFYGNRNTEFNIPLSGSGRA
jgi:dTDP-4-amino-4,6-dideoxygalactose transaminase